MDLTIRRLQQEPRILSQFSQDENMINAYKHGKDLYATIASGVFHNKYEDNLEFKLELVKKNPTKEIINIQQGKTISLLLDDEIITKRGLIKSEYLTNDDFIETSEGFIKIKSINISNIYIELIV